MAINSKSKLREVLEDQRAIDIINEYKPGFVESPDLGPCMGMKIGMLMKFPQAGLTKEQVDEICAKLDALDA